MSSSSSTGPCALHSLRAPHPSPPHSHHPSLPHSSPPPHLPPASPPLTSPIALHPSPPPFLSTTTNRYEDNAGAEDEKRLKAEEDLRERYVAEEEARLTALDAKKKADRKKALQDQKEYAQRRHQQSTLQHCRSLPCKALPLCRSLPPTLLTHPSLPSLLLLHSTQVSLRSDEAAGGGARARSRRTSSTRRRGGRRSARMRRRRSAVRSWQRGAHCSSSTSSTSRSRCKRIRGRGTRHRER